MAMSKQYRTRPSELLGISDSYTAFCFDEACMFILSRIEGMKEKDFDKLNFIENKKECVTPRHYRSYSELVKEVTGK